MRLIAFDTATDVIHLAAVHGERVVVREQAGGALASAGLLPALQALMAEAGLALAELDAVAFGRGPGAFTGLRTACAVAQGLAVGAGKPLLAIDTLRAVAESARRQGATGPVWAAIDARMGEVYAQRFTPGPAGREWHADMSAALYTPAGLAAAVQAAPAPLAGNALLAHAALEVPGAPAWPSARPDGQALAALAAAAWRRGDRLDAAQALPLYVRDKVAQTTEERAAVRATTR